jgi:predicted Zn-dependent protease
MVFVLTVLASLSVNAQVPDVLDLNSGETAMQISLQKELLEILVNDSNEVQETYKKDGTFYTNDKLNQYKEVFTVICKSDPLEKCPEIIFTTRDLSGIASMYPNGVLAINEGIVSRINLSEATFVMAHEYAHYKFQHSRQRVKIIAKTVVDNALMIREPEQALASAGFMVPVTEAHHRYEDQADLYGFNYIIKNDIKINCEDMLNRIAGNETVSTDKHSSISDRCKNYKG